MSADELRTELRVVLAASITTLEANKKEIEAEKARYVELWHLNKEMEKELEAKDNLIATKERDYQVMYKLNQGLENEVEANKKEIAELKERMSQVNDWLNSDTVFNDYEALRGFRLLTKEDRE